MYKHYFFIVLVIVLISGVSHIFADVPNTVNYQGRLTDSDGIAVSDDIYEITFTIYDDLDNPLWSNAKMVEVNNGCFNVILGETLSLENVIKDEAPPLYLGIKIGTNPELSPKTELTSAAYSIYSSYADEAALSNSVAENSVESINIVDGTISFVDIDQNGATEGQVMKWVSGEWVAADDNISPEADTTYLDNRYVNAVGDTITGDLSFDYDDDAVINLKLELETSAFRSYTTLGDPLVYLGRFEDQPVNYSEFRMYSNVSGYEGMKILMETFRTGHMAFYDADNDIGVDMYASPSHGGSINLHNADGILTATLNSGMSGEAGYFAFHTTGGEIPISFNADSTGNSSAVFPDNAVSAQEILNEPGLTSGLGSTNSYFILDQDINTMTPVCSTSIEIPADGYINIIATCNFYAKDVSGHNRAFFMIDDTPEGNIDENNYILAGLSGGYEASEYNAFSVSVNRIYFKSQGTYTFYLEALADTINVTGAVSAVGNVRLTAIYFPTSYGTVEASVSSFQSSEYEKLTPVDNANSGRQNGYTVDLRELEEKSNIEQAEADREYKEFLKMKLENFNK